MIRSFTLRIALWSAFISAIVLIAFGAIALLRINALGISRIDDQLLIRSLPALRARPSDSAAWQRLQAVLAHTYGDDEYLLLGIAANGRPFYKSPTWPEGVSTRRFPAPGPEMPLLRRPLTVYRHGRRWNFRRLCERIWRRQKSHPPQDTKAPDAPAAAKGTAHQRLRRNHRQSENEPSANGAATTAPEVSGTGPDRRDDSAGGRSDRPPRGGRHEQMRQRRGARSKMNDSEKPRGRGRRRPRRIRRPQFTTLKTEDNRWRLGILGTDRLTIVVGASLVDHTRHIRRIAFAFVTILPIPLVLIAAGAWLLSRRALRPVHRLTRTAESVTATGLDRRISPENEDAEFARLITVFNDMMDRLERSFQQATRFSADAAHELKTPLAILQGQLEQALQSAEEGSEHQQVYSELLEEVQRLKSITQKLLILSRADAGNLSLDRNRINLTTIIETLCEDGQVLAPQLTINTELEDDVHVMADRDLLMQLMQNLLSNAIKYNRDDGTIEMELTASGGEARFTISNTGTPIPPEDRERIFSRFYRVDKSRSREIGGIGLGLPLAREIARAHDGDLRLSKTTEDMTTFLLTLPLAEQ